MFDSLPETKSQGSVVHGRTFSTAVVVHLAILLAIASASVFARVEPGEDPPLPASMVVVRFGDPDAGGGGQHPRMEQPKPSQVPVRQDEVVQPVVVPEPVVPVTQSDTSPPMTTPVAVEIGESDGTGEGEGPGKGPGKGPGDKPGIPGDPEGDPNSSSPIGGPRGDKEPIILTIGVDPPVLLVKVEPTYPEMARRAHVEGEVFLEAVIGTDGRVESVRTLKAAHPLLEEAARRAVRQWVYRPATQHGTVVKVYMTVRVNFTLN